MFELSTKFCLFHCSTPGKAIGVEGEASADTLPPTPHHHPATETGSLTGSPKEIAPAMTTAPSKHFDAVEGSRKPRKTVEQLDTPRSKDGSGGENDYLLDVPYTARPPSKPRPGPTPCYARGTSAGAGGVCQR